MPTSRPIEWILAQENDGLSILDGETESGMKMLRLCAGQTTVDLMPARGMSVWQLSHRGESYNRWSPISGPVPPWQIPTWEPSGLGWLEGFDELLVRCGLQSNGPPIHDPSGRLVHPLHGRIGNLAAHSVRRCFDVDRQWVEVCALIDEQRFFSHQWRLQVCVRLHIDGRLQIRDTLTNRSSSEATAMLLYHINFGKPLLSDGSRWIASVHQIAPQNEHAAAGIDRLHEYGPPTAGFAEEVYYAKSRPLSDSTAAAMLINAAGDAAMRIQYTADTLPCFVVWKNTAAEADGYVTGLEPSTNFPNPSPFEKENGRGVRLAGGGSAEFGITLQPLRGWSAVTQAEGEILANHRDQVHAGPQRGWSPL